MLVREAALRIRQGWLPEFGEDPQRIACLLRFANLLGPAATQLADVG